MELRAAARAAHRRSLASSFQVTFTSRTGVVKTLGPLSALYLHRDELREGRGGRLLAKHVGHDWIVDGERYLRLDCEGRARIALLNDQGSEVAVHNARQHFSSIDGIAFADREVFAHLDVRSNRWYVLSDDRDWPAMLVLPAG